MHRAAEPFTSSRRFPEELSHQHLHRNALCDSMSVTSIRARDQVIILERAYRTGGNVFLT
jgi:hypothetical protein